MNLKLSKTAIRELTKRYRAVLLAAVAASAFVATGAKADDPANTVRFYFNPDNSNIVSTTSPTGNPDDPNRYTMPTATYVTNAISSATITQDQVSGLSTALSGKANTSDLGTAASANVLTGSIASATSETDKAKLVNAGQVQTYVTSQGYQTSDNVSSAISSALANSGDAYQTASDVASAISSKANTSDLGTAAAANVLSGTIAGATAETKNNLVSADQVKTYVAPINSQISGLVGAMTDISTAIGHASSGETPATGLVKDIEDLNTALSGKQATIDGEHKLSADLVDDSSATNKFVTAAEKTKLAGIETGAEVNVIETIKVGDTEKTVSGKTVTLGTAADANVLSDTIAENTTSNDLVSASQVAAYAQSAQQVKDAIDAAAGAGLATNSSGKLSVDLAEKSGLSLGTGDTGKLSVNLSTDGTIVKDDSTGALKVGTIGVSNSAADDMAKGTGTYASSTDLTTQGYVDQKLAAKQDTLTAGSGISIDTSTDTISVADLTTSNFATGVIQTTLRDSSSALDTTLASEKAVRTALDTKNDLVNTAIDTTDSKTYKTEVKADASTKTISLNVTNETDDTALAGISIKGATGEVDINGDTNISGDAEITGDATVSGSVTATGGFSVTNASSKERFNVANDGSITLKKDDGTTQTFHVDADTGAVTAGTINATGLKTEVNTSDSSKIDVTLGTAGSTTTVLGNEVVNGTLQIGGSTGPTLTGDTTKLNINKDLTLGTSGSEVFMAGASGLKIGTNLTDTENADVKFNVNTDGSMNAAGGKFQVNANGAIQDVRGIYLSNGSTTLDKVGMTVGTNGELKIGSSDGSSTYLTVETDGDTTVGGRLKIGAAEAITGTDHTLNMAANSLKNTAGLTVGSAGNETFTLGSNGALAIGENLTDSDNKVVNFSVDANGDTKTKGKLTADGRSMFGQYTDPTTSTIKYALDVTSSAVTANKVVEALAGVQFGNDTIAMTSVNHNAAISAMDTADITTTTGNNVVASAQAVAKTRDAINAELNTQLGNIFTVNSTRSLTYNDSINGNGFETGANTLADELTKYAENVANATGLTYDSTGKNTTTYVTKKATDTADYSNIPSATSTTPSTSLKDAIDRIDKNIGLAMTVVDGQGEEGSKVANRSNSAFRTKQNNTVNQNLSALDAAIGVDVTAIADTAVKTASGQNNGVVATNTINQNISALNAAVGDISKLSYDNTDTKSKGNALVNRDDEGHVTGRATTVVEALNNVDATLGTIHGLKAKLAAAGKDKGNLATGTTVEQHLTSLDAAIGDRSQFGRSHYMKANAPVADAMMDLDYNLHRVEKEMKGGFASVAALSALQPNARAAGDTQISMGAGAYRDHQGFAVGAFHYFNDNVLANVGASYAGDKSTMFRAGVTFGW